MVNCQNQDFQDWRIFGMGISNPDISAFSIA